MRWGGVGVRELVTVRTGAEGGLSSLAHSVSDTGSSLSVKVSFFFERLRDVSTPCYLLSHYTKG